MGFQDRDYYREDAPTWWARSSGTRATTTLMALLVLVFVAQVVGSNPGRGRPDRILEAARLDPQAVALGQVWRLVTAHLVHDRSALLVVALTVWAAYYFGRRVEEKLGTREYVGFLLSTALLVSASTLLAGLFGVENGAFDYGSGPVLAAVLVLFACHFPRLQAFLIVAMPAWVLAAIVLGLDLIGEFGGGLARAGVGAYVTAIVWGMAFSRSDRFFTRLFSRTAAPPRAARLKLHRTPPDPATDAAKDDRVAREILGAYTAPRAPARPAAPGLDEQLEAKLDQVLEKVSRSGRDSLTGEEQGILSRASEIYKQRRSPK
jgi:membrane associated rhomboid family serine protease